jgi:hypothetical protein
MIRGKTPVTIRHYEPDPEKELAAITILIDALKKRFDNQKSA